MPKLTIGIVFSVFRNALDYVTRKTLYRPRMLIYNCLNLKEYLESHHPMTYQCQHFDCHVRSGVCCHSDCRGQRTNQLRADVRKMRVTASNFGSILQPVRLNRLILISIKFICCYDIQLNSGVPGEIWNKHSMKPKFVS